jgi:hypothetical protein
VPECQVEVPTDVAHGHTHQLVGLRATGTTVTENCSLENETLVGTCVHTRRSTNAPLSIFTPTVRYAGGRCAHCHADLDEAGSGGRAALRAWHAAEGVSGDLVEAGRAHWLPNEHVASNSQ